METELRVNLITGGDTAQILVTGLAGDEGFEPFDNCYFRTANSMRWEVNRFIKEAAHNHGIGHHLVNSEKYPGTTGWTFYRCSTGQTDSAPSYQAVRTIASELARLDGISVLERNAA